MSQRRGWTHDWTRKHWIYACMCGFAIVTLWLPGFGLDDLFAVAIAVLALTLPVYWLCFRGVKDPAASANRGRRRRHRLASRLRRLGRPKVLFEPPNDSLPATPPSDPPPVAGGVLVVLSVVWATVFGYGAWVYSAPGQATRELFGSAFLLLLALLPMFIWMDFRDPDPRARGRRVRRWLRLGRR